MSTAKAFFKAWSLGMLAVVGALIGGFLIWAVFKSVVEPRVAAQSTCLTKTGCLFTVINGRGSVRVVGFSADGTRLITRGNDILVHDAASGARLARLNPDLERTTGTQFLGNQPEIAAIGPSAIAFFDYDGELLRTWQADSDEQTRDFAPVPRINGFALAQEDGITFYRMSDGERVTQLPNSQGMSQLTTSADGAVLAAYHLATESLHIWPLDNIDNAVTIPDVGRVSGITHTNLQLSADGTLLAAHNETTASVWQAVDGALVQRIDSPEFAITAIALAGNSRRLAVGYNNGFAEVWSLSEGEPLQLFEHRRSLSGLALSPDGTKLAVGLGREATVTRITPQEHWNARRRAAAGKRYNTSDRFLSPNSTYIDTKPGFGIVWEVNPVEL